MCTYSLDPITSTIASNRYRFLLLLLTCLRRNPNNLKLLLVLLLIDDSITTHITCLMHSQRYIRHLLTQIFKEQPKENGKTKRFESLNFAI